MPRKPYKAPENVHKYHHTVWLTEEQEANFQKRLAESNLSKAEFLRVALSSVFVQAVPHKESREEYIQLYKLLLEYKTHFSRISNLIRDIDISLYGEVKELVQEIRKHLKAIQNH